MIANHCIVAGRPVPPRRTNLCRTSLRRTDLRRSDLRRGFSLLEMLLSLAILGGSLAVIAQIADTGVRAAREARDLSLARMLCQSKLSEVLLDATLGQTPQSMFEVPAESFDSTSTTAFIYTIEVQPAGIDGMLLIRVIANATDSDGRVLATYSLDRWLIDPALGLEEAELEEEAAKEAAAGTAEEAV
ncbi:MAG: type II secretion system protein [Pirellulaceae bacterium]|nr:type II secretion system protein [Pirellulaceae bacterium]